MDSIIYASVAELVRAIRSKAISSEELVRAYLRRIEAVNPQLNAVVQLAADIALQQARAADAALARGEILGPLHGIPMTIKDSLDTAGIISTGGTKGRATFIPRQDATVVARLRRAGAILLGKTNTPELTLAFETDNLLYGPTNNPYNLALSSGGSSGGAAAIIAAGGSPFDMGSDTGGSIRLPAHFCGIAGIRPTTGRVPRTGHILPPAGHLNALTVLGPMARFVDDLGLLLRIIAGSDWHDPAVVPMPLRDPDDVSLKHLRVAVYTNNGIITPTPTTVKIVSAAAHALADAVRDVTETRPPGIEQTDEIFAGLFAADGGDTIQELLRQFGTTEPHPWLRRTAPNAPPKATDMARWLLRWDTFRSDMLAFMEHYDLIIVPSAPCLRSRTAQAMIPTKSTASPTPRPTILPAGQRQSFAVASRQKDCRLAFK